jgi:hypothetical protein
MGVDVWGAQPVPDGYQTVAVQYSIPPRLLYAVALTESGQSALSGQQYRPWPWTLNIDGRGEYYRSRRAAWSDLQSAITQGRSSVDIGLMQVNWRYHQGALKSAWQALDPYYNLRVAAQLLSRCHSRHGDWWQSVGCYHAPADPERAMRYQEKVREQWNHLDEAQ